MISCITGEKSITSTWVEMNLAQHIMLPYEFLDRIHPYMRPIHVDFGCGEGFLTWLLARSHDTHITGYEPDPKKISRAQRRSGPNLSFTTYRPAHADSVSSTFVLHEIHNQLFRVIRPMLPPGGYLSILDYHLKGCDTGTFKRVFSAYLEKKEIEQLGLEKAWQRHTWLDLEDCVSMAKGFTTLYKEVLMDKYFLWVGQKN